MRMRNLRPRQPQAAASSGRGNLGTAATSGQREERNPRVELTVDAVAVTADPQPFGCGVDVLRAHTPCLARVPGQGETGHRVDRTDALARYGTRAGRVSPERVVQPALVPPDIHG